MSDSRRYSCFFSFCAFLAAICFSACGGEAGTRVGNPPTTSSVFPQGLVIVSPTAASGSVASLNLSQSQPMQLDYQTATSRIEAILNGENAADCEVILGLLEIENSDASCYGPEIAYAGHPDGNPSAGTLPAGDVGIWLENNDNGEACAAAQLNSRLDGLANNFQFALELFAGMICMAEVRNIDLPQADGTIDLTGELNGILPYFDSATITAANSSTYIYNAVLRIDDGSIPFTNVNLSLEHTYYGENDYSGNIEYSLISNVNDDDCAVNGQTIGAEMNYELTTGRIMTLTASRALYCGDASELIAANGIDPEDMTDFEINPNGWFGDYSRLTATYDTSTRQGLYALSNQAGVLDSHARILDLVLEYDEDDERLFGTAFYGFGDTLAGGGDVVIDGMICNWSGPANNHELQSYVQLQEIQESPSGIFESVSDSLAITYAPTNSCGYDGGGSFTYDSNADGTVDTDQTQIITPDLASFEDNNSNDIADVMEDAGFENITAE